ncbi:MAG: CtsR family transcriptional regulator [Sporomusaceae bacterium]|nr:CtsR family transcriptional regulator [Sporomusaceae bacterium]
MSNVADMIEQFILRKLSGQKDDMLILKRNELASWIDCAPSQVSYVLSTRFTIDRGYIVESRRGSGGFVRIARLPFAEIVHHETRRIDDENLSKDEAIALIGRLKEQNFITQREAALIEYFFTIFYDKVSPADRPQLIRSVLLVLARQSERSGE